LLYEVSASIILVSSCLLLTLGVVEAAEAGSVLLLPMAVSAGEDAKDSFLRNRDTIEVTRRANKSKAQFVLGDSAFYKSAEAHRTRNAVRISICRAGF
jgi:hypothetical protein